MGVLQDNSLNWKKARASECWHAPFCLPGIESMSLTGKHTWPWKALVPQWRSASVLCCPRRHQCPNSNDCIMHVFTLPQCVCWLQ